MAAIKPKFPKIDFKTMSDAIHGQIRIHPLINAVIDTPHFQRLRNIKQLGLTYHVYPSACHNRFEHSIGTYHLASKFLETLNKYREITSEHEREEREKETLCVQIAALCHDLGHGPFSHLWEVFLSHFDIKWTHEENSIKVFDLMLDEQIIDKHSLKRIRTDEGKPITGGRIKLRDLFSFYDINETEISLIKDLIMGKKAGSTPPDKHYLYQIISNNDNDIDVDKFDYMLRDSKMLNLSVQFDMERIMMYGQIMDTDVGITQICFRRKVCPNIADMFYCRAMLHDKAYQHPKVKIIEEMVIDALKLAAKNYDYLKSTDPNRILAWTDHIYEEILFGDQEILIEAKRMLTRIAKRELYKLIKKIEVMHTENISRKKLNRTTDELCQELVKRNQSAYKNLKKEELGIIMVEINTCKSNEDVPLENVYVFRKSRSNNLVNDNNNCTGKRYNWDESTTLMPPLNNPNYPFKKILKRKLFLIYKGEDQKVSNQLRADKGFISKAKGLMELASKSSAG